MMGRELIILAKTIRRTYIGSCGGELLIFHGLTFVKAEAIDKISQDVCLA